MDKGLALYTGSAVVFLALGDPAFLLLLLLGLSPAGPEPGLPAHSCQGLCEGAWCGQGEELSPRGVPAPLAEEESISCRGDVGVTSPYNYLRGLRISGGPV